MAAPFELKFLVDVASALEGIKQFTEGTAGIVKASAEAGETLKSVAGFVGSFAEAAVQGAAACAEITAAEQGAAGAGQAEAAELERLTQLLGDAGAARASLAATITDTTAATAAATAETAAGARATEEASVATRAYGESMTARAAAMMAGETADRSAQESVGQLGMGFRRLTEDERAATRAKQTLDEVAGQASGLGSMLTMLGLVDPPLLRVGVGLQMASQAAEMFGPKIIAAGGGLSGFLEVLGPLAAIGGAVTAVLVGLGVAYKATEFAATEFKEALSAGVEELAEQDSLARLTGNLETAKERLEEIGKLSVTSLAFKTDDLVEADEKLQLFSRGALGSIESLKMVADAAAGTQKPILTVAENVGRLEGALASGQGPGRYAAALQRLGVLTGAATTELANMAKSGRSGGEMWEFVRQQLLLWQGQSERSAGTFGGLMTTISNAWNLMKKVFGAPIDDSLRPLLADLRVLLADFVPKAQQAGKAIAEAIGTIYGLVKSGNFVESWELTLRIAIDNSALFFIRTFTNAVDEIGKKFANMFSEAFNNLKNGDIMHLLFTDAEADGLGSMGRKFNQALGLNHLGLNGTNPAPDSPQASQVPLRPQEQNQPLSTEEQYVIDRQRTIEERQKLLADALAKTTSSTPDTTPGKPPGDGGEVDPLKKSKSSSGGPKGRKAEVDQGAEAEKAYRSSLDETNEALALGEISSSQAATQNTAIITAYIKRLGDLQKTLPPTSDKFREMSVKIRDAEQMLAQQHVWTNIRYQLRQLANDWTNLAKQAGAAAKEIATSITSGIGNAITGLITQTTTWKEAFMEAGKAIISTIVQMVVQYTVGRAVIAVINAVAGGSEASAANTQASQAAVAWAPAATSASIASYGVAAGVGLAAYVAALGTGAAAAAGASAFQKGGFTGHGADDEVAGIVHKNEFVLPAAATRHWGVDTLQALASMRIPVASPRGLGSGVAAGGPANGYSPTGRASGPRSGRASQQQTQHHTYVFFDEDAMARHMRGAKGTKTILNAVTGHAVDLGNAT